MLKKEVAEKIGVHPVTLSRWLAGDRYPERSKMLIIQELFGWSVTQQMLAYEKSAAAPEAYGEALAKHIAPWVTDPETRY